MKLIDKDALVKKIKEWTTLLMNEINQKGASQIDKLSLGSRIAELQEVNSFLDTLEVKEVDFHKELLSFYRHTNDSGSEIALAKHFYELGLKAQKGE